MTRARAGGAAALAAVVLAGAKVCKQGIIFLVGYAQWAIASSTIVSRE